MSCDASAWSSSPWFLISSAVSGCQKQQKKSKKKKVQQTLDKSTRVTGRVSRPLMCFQEKVPVPRLTSAFPVGALLTTELITKT